MALDSSRSLFFTSSSISSRIPTGLGLSFAEVCWRRTHFSFLFSSPSGTFLDQILFSQKCPRVLYEVDSNSVGKDSLLDLLESSANFEADLYSSLKQSLHSSLPNSSHLDVFSSSQTESLQTSLDLKLNNSSAQVSNFSKLVAKQSDSFHVIKSDLVGLNKECFQSDSTYSQVFDFGWAALILSLEQFSISKFGVALENSTARKLKGNSNRKLERKLSNSLFKIPPETTPDKTDSILMNLTKPNPQSQKLSKTGVAVFSLSDLHILAANSLGNVYSLQSLVQPVFLSLLICAALAILFIACAEYDYRITRNNTCSKVCYSIFLGLLFLGIVVSSVIILICQVAVKNVISNIKEHVCIDLDLVSQVEEDLVISNLLIPICVGLGLTILLSILGLFLSCHFFKKRWKYRLWKPTGGRFM